MITVLSSLTLIVLTVIIIALCMNVKYLLKEIDNIEEVVGNYRIELKYLKKRLNQLEKRLDQLKDVQTTERR